MQQRKNEENNNVALARRDKKQFHRPVEKIRCLLAHAHLPKSFWAEAARCSVYLINRSPTKILGRTKKLPSTLESLDAYAMSRYLRNIGRS